MASGEPVHTERIPGCGCPSCQHGPPRFVCERCGAVAPTPRVGFHPGCGGIWTIADGDQPLKLVVTDMEDGFEIVVEAEPGGYFITSLGATNYRFEIRG